MLIYYAVMLLAVIMLYNAIMLSFITLLTCLVTCNNTITRTYLRELKIQKKRPIFQS